MKQRFQIMKYDINTCVHCKTLEEATKFLNYLDSIGMTWNSGAKYTKFLKWNTYKENTVYYFKMGLVSNIKKAKRKYSLILEYSEVFKEISKIKYLE